MRTFEASAAMNVRGGGTSSPGQAEGLGGNTGNRSEAENARTRTSPQDPESSRQTATRENLLNALGRMEITNPERLVAYSQQHSPLTQQGTGIRDC